MLDRTKDISVAAQAWLDEFRDALGKPEQAVDVLSEGLGADPLNADVYLALDQALSLLQRPAAERLRALDRYTLQIRLAEPSPRFVNTLSLATPVGAGKDYGLIAPPEYWQAIREICDRYDVLLIADEVVTGFGRTGRWFAMEHFGVQADIMTTAKGISGLVVPMGAVTVSDEVNEPFAAGEESRTKDLPDLSGQVVRGESDGRRGERRPAERALQAQPRGERQPPHIRQRADLRGVDAHFRKPPLVKWHARGYAADSLLQALELQLLKRRPW